MPGWTRTTTILATLLALCPLPGHAQDATAPIGSAEAGAALFAENCAACHGADAHGNGPAAADLATQPPDLTRIADRRDGIWPLFEVMSIIDGYTRQTTPRPDMPILPDLTSGPMIDVETGNGLPVAAPANLLAVALYLEGLQSPPPDRYVP
jgi:mono/diheme cytochrome c family protein